jgi:hypothetical protein
VDMPGGVAAARSIAFFRQLFHLAEGGRLFFHAGQPINRRVQDVFFLLVVRRQRLEKLLFLALAVHVLAADLVVQGLQTPSDLSMLRTHDHRGTVIAQAALVLEEWEQNRFFRDDVPLQAELKLPEGSLGLGKIDTLQLPVLLQQLIQRMVMLLMADLYWGARSLSPSHSTLGSVRHALTVGFMTTLILGVGQRLLPILGHTLLPWPQNFAASLLATGGTHCRPPDPRLASLCCRENAVTLLENRNEVPCCFE